MRIALAVFCLLLSATAAAETPPEADLILHPNWARLPDGADMARLYPDKAFEGRVGGSASIICQVQADGGLDDCTVLTPVPDTDGFGQATRRLAVRHMRLKAVDKDGLATAGRYVRVTMNWNPPG